MSRLWRWGVAITGAGAAACVLMCMAPGVVAAAGVVLEGAFPRVGLVLVGLGVVGALGMGVAHRRQACGCPSEGHRRTFLGSGPVFCSLDADGLRDRVGAFSTLFGRGLRSATRGPGGEVVWVFDRGAVAREVIALAEQEHRCCPFLEFDIQEDEETITWRIDAPPGAEGVLDAFAALPTKSAGGREALGLLEVDDVEGADDA